MYDADPTADIANAARVAVVVANGRAFRVRRDAAGRLLTAGALVPLR